VQARFPLQQSYRTELRQLYDQTVELVPLDFTRKPHYPTAKEYYELRRNYGESSKKEHAEALHFCPPYATPHQEVGEGCGYLDRWVKSREK
jgi:hypothetical protein